MNTVDYPLFQKFGAMAKQQSFGDRKKTTIKAQEPFMIAFPQKQSPILWPAGQHTVCVDMRCVRRYVPPKPGVYLFLLLQKNISAERRKMRLKRPRERD
jgi:hypothetical protein